MVMIRYEELELLIKDIEKEKDKLKECIIELEGQIRQIPVLWESETSDKFVDDYRKKSRSLKETVRYLDDMIFTINGICATCNKLYESNHEDDI